RLLCSYFVLLSSLLRLPPCYTLFPYTTLFRSQWRAERALRDRLDLAGRPARYLSRKIHRHWHCAHCHSGYQHGAWSFLGEDVHRDRKSTRLNSSHLGISYAVFCLKKKKITNQV